MYYAYPVDLTCVSTCTAPYFAFVGNQTCVLTCPPTPNITNYDYVNRKCVTQCPANTYAASNQSCLASKNSAIQPVLRELGDIKGRTNACLHAL
jgi:hypothetical protein